MPAPSMTANGQVSAWRIGWASAKANAVPMVVLWCLAAATVVAYYLVPGVAAVFEPLMRWQVESGWVAAFLNRFVFATVARRVHAVVTASACAGLPRG